MEKKKITYIKTNELILNSQNPRKNDNAVDTVAKSIKNYGFQTPLIVDKDYKVWCGRAV